MAMNQYRDPSQQQQPISVTMSPIPGSLGGPPQMTAQLSQQPPPQPGLPGIGMGRGASSSGLQNSGPLVGNIVPEHLVGQSSQQFQNEYTERNDVQLNTYIYEHLLRNGFHIAARGLLKETQINVLKPTRDGSEPNQDGDGNPHLSRRAATLKRSQSGIDNHPISSPSDKANGKSPGSVSNSPHIEHGDLPEPNCPLKGSGPNGFLRDWWAIFWDIHAARCQRPSTSWAMNYLDTQRNQGLLPQVQGQYNPPVQHRSQMMNGVADDTNMDKSKKLMQHAMVNNGRKASRPTNPVAMQQGQPPNPAQIMALKQQPQAQQRENDSDPNSSSPALGQDNSPNKRQRVTPPTEFSMSGHLPPQGGPPPNGIHAAQQQANLLALQSPQNALQLLRQAGVQIAPNATQADILNLARQLIASSQGQQGASKQLAAYKQNLAVQQTQQSLAATRAGLGAGGASPANPQAQIPFGNPGLPGGPYVKPTQEQMAIMTEHAKQLGGSLSHPSTGGSHSLMEYQSQLMILEQQNKKRLLTARSETGGRGDDPANPPLNGQINQQQGQGLQPGQPQLQGTNMSPSNSRTGPSPQIPHLDITQQQGQQQQQRKAGQKTGSGAASPEPEQTGAQIRGPSPAFGGPQGGVTDQYQQMTQLGQYQMVIGQSGQPQFVAGRPPPGIPFGAAQANPVAMDMLRARQPGQQFPHGWAPQLMNQPQMRQQAMIPQGMVSVQHGPQGQPVNTAQQQMPPPPQPQPTQAGRPQAPGESPSLASAQPPTPTQANKAAPKGKATKERPKRNRGKGAAAPATPNASEPPTPTTPITPHAPNFGQHAPAQASQAQAAQPQPTSQQPPLDQPPPPPSQDGPSAFGAIEAADAGNELWNDDKWMGQIPMDFSNNFAGTGIGDFGSTNFSVGDEDIINYGEFLNDNEGLGMDMPLWGDELGAPEA